MRKAPRLALLPLLVLASLGSFAGYASAGPNLGNPGYAERHGAFVVEVLPQYQLIEGMLAQSMWAEHLCFEPDRNEYVASLMEFMAPYRDHRAVRMMNEISGDGFSALGFIVYALHLGPLPVLESALEFEQSRYWTTADGKADMEEFRLAMKALAEESGFLTFVKRRELQCSAWVKQAMAKSNLDAVGEWLVQFSGTRPSEFHVVLSPALTGIWFGPSVMDKERGQIPYVILSSVSTKGGSPVFPSGIGLGQVAVHEFGHSFVDPPLDAHAERIDSFPALTEELRGQMSYGEAFVRGFVTENVLRAVTSTAEGEIYGKAFGAYRILAHERHGYYLTGLLAKDLKEYMAHRDIFPTFADFVPTLLDRVEHYRTMENARWRLWLLEYWRAGLTAALSALGLACLVLRLRAKAKGVSQAKGGTADN